MAMEYYNSDGIKKPEQGERTRKFGMIPIAIIIAALIFLLLNSMVITKENQFKLIRQFGRVERVLTQAGLSFKIPFVESVDTIPKELLIYDLPASDVITSDKKTMIVDSYVLWHVTDPLKFADRKSTRLNSSHWS